MAEDLDPAVYSLQSEWVADDTSPEGGRFVRKTWRELSADLQREVFRLQGYATFVSDLDRNENGRHEGDADVGDPTGVSQGNPRLRTGDVVGYALGGQPYVMPERGHRHDLAAWRTTAPRTARL